VTTQENKVNSTTSATTTEPVTDIHGISRAVPPELWLAVLCGVLDEDVAIARGLLAAGTTSPEERRRVLFAVAGDFDTTLTSTPPAPGYRPCGSPPWGEP
jgi:hypothetical protein